MPHLIALPSRAVCSCGMQLGSSIQNCQPETTMLPAGQSETLLAFPLSHPRLHPPDNFWVMKPARTATGQDRRMGWGDGGRREIYAQVVFCKSYGLIITTWQCLQCSFSLFTLKYLNLRAFSKLLPSSSSLCNRSLRRLRSEGSRNMSCILPHWGLNWTYRKQLKHSHKQHTHTHTTAVCGKCGMWQGREK